MHCDMWDTCIIAQSACSRCINMHARCIRNITWWAMSPYRQEFSKKTPILSMNSNSDMRFISICLQWDQGAKSIFKKDKKYQKYQRLPSEATWMHAMTCDTWRIDPSSSEATCMYAMTCDTCHGVTFHRLPDEGNNRRNGDALEFQMSSSCSIVAFITESNWFC